MRIRMPSSRENARPESTRAATSAGKEPTTVEEAIEQFRNSNFPSKWPNVDKAKLLEDIIKSVKDPFQINQNYTPFCGPASITFDLVSKQPIQYVRFIKQIYEKGQFKTKDGKIIKAGRKLLESQIPIEITPADWVFMGTLRDDKNLFANVKSSGGWDNPSGIAGMTGVPAMISWTKHVLGYRKSKYKSAAVFGDVKQLKKVSSIVNRGGAGFLLIHSGLVGGKVPKWDGPQFPNHWIVYLGNLKLNKRNNVDAVQFDTYTWGSTVHIKTSKDNFRQFYLGAVVGEP